MMWVIMLIRNNPLVNIEKNKDSDITVVIGQIDELSCDNIRRNYNKVTMLEEQFTDRLDYSKEILTKKLLPKQLQSDFEIVPQYLGNKLDFETKPITSDAYEKFPMRINYTLKFDDKEVAKRFKKNGISELIKKTEETGKPVEIPNIIKMKEFLGDYENPVSYINKYGCEGIKLYVCPSPLPPAQKYKIDIFNEQLSFNIVTNLRMKNRNTKNIVLTNDESKDEPYNIEISLKDIKKDKNGISGKFNITISLRKKDFNRSDYNIEMMKYRYLIEDSNNHIQISNVELNKNIFAFDNCGKIKHTKKQFKEFKCLCELIEKVIYISKVKNINIKYNLNSFIKNEDLINLVYSECIGKTCKVKNKMMFTEELPDNPETREFCNQNKVFNITSQLRYVDFFGFKIRLKPNKLIMNNCSFVDIVKENNRCIIKIESSDITFKALK